MDRGCLTCRSGPVDGKKSRSARESLRYLGGSRASRCAIRSTVDGPLRLLLLDPDPAALPAPFADLAPEIVRVPSVEAALATMRSEASQLVVSEVLLPGLSGFELARRLSARDDAPPVLIRTRLPGDRFLPRAIRAGARGFVQTAADAEVLGQALRALIDGRAFWDSPGMQQTSGGGPHDAAMQALDQRIDALTPRLFEALHLLLQGMDSAETADAMHVTRRSAAGYRRELCRALGVGRDGDLSRIATRVDASFYAGSASAARAER